MKLLKKSILYTLVFFVSVSLVIELGQSITSSINIKPGSEFEQILNLELEDHVLIQIKTLGVSSNNFSSKLFLPNGSLIEFGEEKQIDYSFICEIEGQYILKFFNNDTQNDTLITLNYEIQNYVFGMPKMLFLTLMIVGICLVGVVIFVFLGKTGSYLFFFLS